MSRPAIAAALLFAFAGPSVTAGPAAVAIAPACEAVEYRGLDFWLGRWQVETRKGEPAGTSRIELALSGCVILEHWTGLFLTTGRVQEGLGVHRYDAATGQWRQAWVDETPSTQDSVGRKMGDSMVYDEPAGADGTRTRMTLAPLGDGRVEQRGERWDAATGSWQTTFHLVYRREH